MDKPIRGIDQIEIWYLDLIRVHEFNQVWPSELPYKQIPIGQKQYKHNKMFNDIQIMTLSK
jgi:hypothetical protein